ILYGKLQGSRSSALRATFVDTRNDVIATVSSLVGWFLAERGLLWADAALALPVALYVGYSGFELARENLRYLMGEAPSSERLSELRAEAASVPGVLEVRALRAQFLGQELHAEVTILVALSESATEAHDIALAVRRRLEAVEGVGEIFVHIDTRETTDHA
ncbi:MAG: cation diffusion facilitator family transporter, partial [Planctomycetota bacterium]